MDSHAIATEAGSLVLAASSCISDNLAAILAVTVVSWLFTSAAASEKITAACSSFALHIVDSASRTYRLLENALEEVWYTIAAAPEDAVAYMKRAVASLTPTAARESLARLAAFRVEMGHLIHAIGFFVLFFRLAPGTDKKRFQRSWSLATAVYLAAVDWFVLAVSWIAAPEHPIIFFESLKTTMLDALVDLATEVLEPVMRDRLSAIWALLLVACSLLAAAKVVLLAVGSLERSAGLSVGDRQTFKVPLHNKFYVSAPPPEAQQEQAEPLRIITSPRLGRMPTQKRPSLPRLKNPMHMSPVRAKSARRLTPTVREWTSEALAPDLYSPIKSRRDLAKFRRYDRRGGMRSLQYRRTWQRYEYRPSPIDTRPELWQEVLSRAPSMPSPIRIRLPIRIRGSNLTGTTEFSPGAQFPPVDAGTVADATTPPTGSVGEV